jgi:hypothetical protein
MRIGINVTIYILNGYSLSIGTTQRWFLSLRRLGQGQLCQSGLL